MPQRCHFCEDEAHGPCSWPVELFEETEAGLLKVGDTVRRYQESTRTDWSVATVEHLERLAGGLIRVSLSIRTKTWAVRGKTFEANDFSRCRVLVKRPCGAAACHAHLVCRAPGVYYCWDHVHAWEKIA